MKFVKIESCGIVQLVSEVDLSMYTRAGYKIVEENASPDPLTDIPEGMTPAEPEEDTKPEVHKRGRSSR